MAEQDRGSVYEEKNRIHEIQREDAQRAHDGAAQFHEKTNDAAIKNADATLRAALLINGGAAVSVLAFIGGLASQNRIKLDQLNDVANSLMLFAFGVAAAVASMGLSYFTNYVAASHSNSFVRSWQHPYLLPGAATKRLAWLKMTLHTAAAIFGLASLVLFIIGMLDVHNAITRLK